MSTYRACAIPDRVVIIHDTPEQTFISELDRDAANLLIHQLQAAIKDGFGAISQTLFEAS